MERYDPMPGFDADERRVWLAAILVQMRLRHAMSRQMQADNGISLAEFGIFVALNGAPQESMRLGDLAVRIGWELSRLSHQVKRMAARGLVETQRCADDRRATEVKLTERGGAMIAGAIDGHIKLARELYIDAVPEGLMVPLRDAMEAIYANIVARDGQATH